MDARCRSLPIILLATGIAAIAVRAYLDRRDTFHFFRQPFSYSITNDVISFHKPRGINLAVTNARLAARLLETRYTPVVVEGRERLRAGRVIDWTGRVEVPRQSE